MQTEAFASGIDELIGLASESPTAIMCAESVPWRCHRSLIADALLARGFPVEHILSPTRRQLHTLTPFAKLRGLPHYLSGIGVASMSSLLTMS